MAIKTVPADRLLRIKEVLVIIPVARSTWWLWVKNGKAPKPVVVCGCTFWRYSDLMDFINEVYTEW